MRLISEAMVCACLGLAGAGCGLLDRTPPPQLSSIENDYLDALFNFHPTFASRQGLRQYDGRLDDISALSVGRRIDELGRTLARLQTLREAGVAPREENDAAILDHFLRAELLDYREIEHWRHDPALYLEIPLLAIDHMMRGNYAPASERLRSIIISVHETQAILASMRGNVSGAPAPVVRRAIRASHQLDALMNKDLPAWAQEAAGVDMRLVNSFGAAAPGAQEAVAASRRWLESELAPQATQDFALGAEKLAMMLLFRTMVDLPLERIVAEGEAALAHDTAAFEEAARAIAPGQAAGTVLATVQGRRITASAMEEYVSRILGEVRTFVTGSFLPALPAEMIPHVLAAPPHLQTASEPFLGRLPGMLGQERADGYLFVTTGAGWWDAPLQSEHGRRLTEEELALAIIHHLLPGNYTLALARRQNESLTRVAKLHPNRLTCDGWSHYAELALLESGYQRDNPRFRLIQAHRAMIRDCRVIASMQLHLRRMTLAEAAAMFERSAHLPPALARLEAERAVWDPLCLSDGLGRLLILKLREDYRSAKGPDYSLEAFHRDFLALGGMPLPLVRKALLPDGGGR